jgi:hypothetical protein
MTSLPVGDSETILTLPCNTAIIVRPGEPLAKISCPAR